MENDEILKIISIGKRLKELGEILLACNEIDKNSPELVLNNMELNSYLLTSMKHGNVDSLFVWDETPEGLDYWAELDQKIRERRK